MSMWTIIARLLALRPVASALIAYAQREPYVHLAGYMRRFWVFNPFAERSGSGTRYPVSISARVHHILRADYDRNLHDHPWNARTIILRGWYRELREDGTEYTRRAGDTATLAYGEFHRILEVSPGGVHTLFITGRYRGTWGFRVGDRKVPHREYLR